MNIVQTYEDAPASFCRCMADKCTACAQCLRYQTHLNPNSEAVRIPYLNPLKTQPDKGAECPYFVTTEKERMAYGFKMALGEMTTNLNDTIMYGLRRKYGNNRYYHYRNGETRLTPKMQQTILNDLQSLGATLPLEFDRYEECYKW